MLGNAAPFKNPWDMSSHGNNEATTTLDPENSQVAQQKGKPSKDVSWYQKEIKNLAPETREFLAEYTGIKDEEQLKKLIYKVRDMAWDVCPYHCIGLFRFLDFSIHLSSIYPSIVKRVREGAVFLDLGCCLGQDIRRLAHDSGISHQPDGVDNQPASPVHLFGAELFADFIAAGYELFGDRATLPARMIQADVLAPDGDIDPLSELYGKVDIIYLGSFLHQFDAAKQRVIVRKIGRLLRADDRGLVFGRHLGAAGQDTGGEFKLKDAGWNLYRHDEATIRRLFEDQEPEAGQWLVTSDLTAYKSKNWENEKGKPGADTAQMSFAAIREAGTAA